jgi:hypothetical protein
MGEYARSLAIAQAVRRQWPEAEIHFILNRQAPYAAQAPFPATLLESSPTFHSAAVIELIEKLRPALVVFDNAGRTAQLRAARRTGARVVYISARSRQRSKAFRLSWMRLLDEHWIAYPEFIAGPLSPVERFKLTLLGRPTVRYLDVILSRAAPEQRDSIMVRAGVDVGSYVLVVPGGGTDHPGASEAVGRFFAAASLLAQGGVPTLFVGPSGPLPPGSRLRCFASLPQADLVELMRGSRLMVVNGGSTLLQAIACGRACVAIPIARDQAKRIQHCVRAGVAIAAPLDAENIAAAASKLLQDDALRLALAQRAADLGLADGIEIALRGLARLAALPSSNAAAVER